MRLVKQTVKHIKANQRMKIIAFFHIGRSHVSVALNRLVIFYAFTYSPFRCSFALAVVQKANSLNAV